MGEQTTYPLGLGQMSQGQAMDAEAILLSFLGYVESKGLALYPAQEEAILEIAAGNNVILNTPTGSGKSLVGLAACHRALHLGQRAYYTAPIKALVSEKFLELCRAFGPSLVGMMTGDASVNSDAPIIACTAEILANFALRRGPELDVGWVVMDEFHYYSDRERGAAWQIPLLTLSQARFVLMSATLGDTKRFEEGATRLTGAPTKLVRSSERPVPLDYAYAETPLHETVGDLPKEGKAPVYIVHFSQVAASEQAQRLTSLDFLSKDQKGVLKEELKGVRFDSPFGRELARFLPHGIGVHHAGMLPKYRLLVEKLAQRGLLKVICGTDTLGVGVNIPLRTVLFTQLCKYDGDKTKILSVRDFHQIAGRAGRRGFDTQGSVVVQAPEHVIENLQATRKAAGDPKKLKKLHMKKAPEHGFAPWDAKTLEKLRTSEPEPLTSRFYVSHGMLLNVLSRDVGGCSAMKGLLRDCHETPPQKKKLRATGISMFRALWESKIIELTREGPRVHADLQEDFSLDHALSLFAVQAIESLDRESRDYPLTVLSIIESILENPTILLRRQVDKLKTIRMTELKAAGVSYEERMEELEKVTYPKPEEEFLEATFAVFAEVHPWLMGQRIEPKSIVRDWYEQGLSFTSYIKEYGLERSEGVLLRYLSEAYRALERTVPDQCKSEELYDVIDWLGAEVRGADASLLEEWQRLMNPEKAISVEAEAVEPERRVTADKRTFLASVRTEIFRVLQHLARRDYVGAAELLNEATPIVNGEAQKTWTRSSLEELFAPYFGEFERLEIGPNARAKSLFRVREDEEYWDIEQVLSDPDETNAFRLDFELDTVLSDERERPVFALVGLLRD